MALEIKEFSLLNIGSQFHEFNSAVKKNRNRLAPYFWWANMNAGARFCFILSGLVAEKLTVVFHDLPYNKKFIIRRNGEFAGIVGLDGLAQGAPRAELWFFVVREHECQHAASRAIKQVEAFAQKKSVKKLYAQTKWDNMDARQLLHHNNFEVYDIKRYAKEQILWWEKTLSTKVIEK